jgi:sulfur carrier protein
MTLLVNGEEKTLEQPITLQEALRLWGYDGLPVAIALNEEFLPRSRYHETALQDGDRIEILSPMQGG